MPQFREGTAPVVLANAYQTSGTTSGAEYKNKKTQVIISPGAATSPLVIPAGFLSVGNLLRLTALGRFSGVATGKFEIGIAISNGEALTEVGGEKWKFLATTGEVAAKESAAELTWRLEAYSRVTKTGEEGVMLTQGIFQGIVNATKPTGEASVGACMLPKTTATGGEVTAIKLTKEQAFGLAYKNTVESAENIVFCYQWLVELLN